MEAPHRAFNLIRKGEERNSKRLQSNTPGANDSLGRKFNRKRSLRNHDSARRDRKVLNESR
jgi:hypothetical protein